ncbi:MAG: sugar phosphate isomerase/epimerase family protein [Candidatus Levybacteria bacterium]|nr:sugar phosphate isomerase/epimerase family protein [Candidatus Levybacteria bacterium]
MNIAISNIAWNKEEDGEIAKILKKYKISGIEVAPTKIWKNPLEANDKEVKRYKNYWLDNGIRIIAMQSLLFGHPELTIFDSKETRAKTIDYISRIIHLSFLLDSRIMVFGSPKNRKVNGLEHNKALGIACEFFYKIAEICRPYNIFFCIEPNPPQYGADFILNTNDAIKLVTAVNHPHFRLHLDTSTMTINRESYEDSIKNGLSILKHFHISEPYLEPIEKEGKVDNGKIAAVLKKLNYNDNKWISIEMRSSDNDSNIERVDKALALVTGIYR